MNNHTPYRIVSGMGCDFMNFYEILINGQVAGKAIVETKGLFTAFHCRCKLSAPGVYRIYASYADKKIDLGICVPDKDEFVVSTKIPTKHLGEGVPVFYGLDIHEKQEAIIPVSNEKTFDYLHKITDAKLCIVNGQIGVVLNGVNLREDHRYM